MKKPQLKGLLRDFAALCDIKLWKDILKASSSSKISFNTLYENYIALLKKKKKKEKKTYIMLLLSNYMWY